MSLLEPPSMAGAVALGAGGLVLVTAYVYVLVELCFLRQRWTTVAAMAVLLVGTTLLTWLDTLRIELLINPTWDLWGLAGLVNRLPVLALGISLAVGYALAVCLIVWVRGIRRSRITPDSVKEALDALPDGVCFSRPDGSPLLVNARMDELAHDLFGTHVNDDVRLWERISAGDLPEGVTCERMADDTGLLLRIPDARGWTFRRSEIETQSGPVIETIATNVSEELALASELELRNRQLAEVGQRLRTYSSDLVRLTREEEILAAKVRVHDEVGRALVALRAYERQEPARRNREALLNAWHRTTRLVQIASEDEGAADPWRLLDEAARAVDVRLRVSGELPASGAVRDLLVMIVHECLNNAVRHAGAHEVEVYLSPVAKGLQVRVTNDGVAPSGPIDETGGLANLRAAIERAHGTMLVEWSPRFAVVVRLKLGGG